MHACVHTHKPAYWISTVCLSTYQLFLTIDKLSNNWQLTNNWQMNVQTKTWLAHDSSIHNNQRVKTTQIFNNRWQKEQDVYIQTTEYYPPYCDVLILPDHRLSDRKHSQKTLFTIQLAKSVESSSWNNKELIEPALTLLLILHVWGVSAVWESRRWTPGTLNR